MLVPLANPNKTAFLVLNSGKKIVEPINIKIGDAIVKNQSNAKLLGMKFEDNLKWNEHIQGKGGEITTYSSDFEPAWYLCFA